MCGLFHKRWVVVLTMALWASAAMVQGLAPALSSLVPEPKTEVEAHSIETAESHPQGVCNHHPQGCPADCFCPKTGFVVGDAVSESLDRSELLGVPAWVECSESRAVSAPTFAVYLPEPTREISVREISEAFALSPPAPARDVFCAPPAKIPIA